jgi:para-nitrobenzyl esterase
MKQKLLLVMFTAMTCLLSQYSHAQTRYQDSIFASYTLDSVTYSSVYGFKMDIYQPAGDNQATRPVVVLAHEGTFISGTRESDPTVVRLCQDLAHKGYVTVSIDYTLIPFADIANLTNADSAALEVFRAVSDAKAAVRFLYEDASTTNTYKIDTNNIYIGGNSAGAVLAMQYAYIDSAPQLAVNPDYTSLVNSIGGLNGNSGNPGYSSNVKGVVSLAGGLNQVSWLGYCGKPIVMAQGSIDSVVPFVCGDPNVGLPVPLQLCGLGSLAPSIKANTPYSDTLVFYGSAHVPWDTDPSMFYQVDTLVTGFLYAEVSGAAPSVCTGFPLGVNNLVNPANIQVYPNPATFMVNVQASQFISGVTMLDETGRTVVQMSDLHDLSYQVNTSRLSSGIYFVRIDCGLATPVIRKITIE